MSYLFVALGLGYFSVKKKKKERKKARVSWEMCLEGSMKLMH